MLKLVATDLDDTLIRNDWKVSDRAVDALHRWRDERGPVVIATGRPPRMTRRIREELHDFPWICYNGAIAYENGEEIYRNNIGPEIVQQIVERLLAEMPNEWTGLEIDDVLYMNHTMNEPKRGAVQVDDLRAYTEHSAAKILTTRTAFLTLYEREPALFQHTHPLVSDRVSMVQIQAETASKGTALTELVPRWGYAMENVIAFGDDVNDIEMVRDSGLGIAVDNAVEEVKAVANRITASNQDDGVAVILEELLTSYEVYSP